jgi:ABC-type sugar transport system ATPase subunit
MKTLAGMHQPDEGRIFVEDREVTLPNPIAAKQAGIMLIHQELSLAEDLTVAENVFLGELPTVSASASSTGRRCTTTPPPFSSG